MSENECIICLETKCVFKVLPDCSHAFCEVCCKKLIKTDLVFFIKCPLCLRSSILDENSLYTLQTKIRPLKGILCDSCSKASQLDDHWWCNDCNEAVCSSCFMKKHNKHDSRICDDVLLFRECLAAVKPIATIDQEKENLINKFCHELKTRMSISVNARSFINAAEALIGDNDLDTVHDSIESVGSKMIFASKILNACEIDQSNKEIDVTLLGKVCNLKTISNKYDLSKLDLISEMFHVMPEINIAMQATSQKTVMSETKNRIKWDSMINMKLQNSTSMCIVPSSGTIVIVGSQGLYKFDKTLKNAIFKGWSIQLAKGNSLFDSSIVYHPQRKTCFIAIANDKNGKLFEYGVDPLKMHFHYQMPRQSVNGDAYLINILPDGKLICARSEPQARYFIWLLLNFSSPISNWRTVWDSNSIDKDTFLELSAIIPNSENDKSNIIVLGENNLYLFNVIGASCTLLTKLTNLNYNSGPSVGINDRIFYLDQNRNYMFPYTNFTADSLIKVDNGVCDGKNDKKLIWHASERILMTCTKDKICLLNCVKQKLYVGSLIVD